MIIQLMGKIYEKKVKYEETWLKFSEYLSAKAQKGSQRNNQFLKLYMLGYSCLYRIGLGFM